MTTGASQVVLSGPDVGDYCFLSNSKELIYSASDAKKHSKIWRVPLDHSLSPKTISPDEDDESNVWCLENGEVVFRRHENAPEVVSRMEPDDGKIAKLFPNPVLQMMAISPDGIWLVVLLHKIGDSPTVEIYNLRNGSAKTICEACNAWWSPYGNRLYLSYAVVGKDESTTHGQTYVLPWTPGTKLEAVFPGNPRTEADIAKLATIVPAARQVQEFAAGPSPDVFAYSRRTIQRNLYRVPLPGFQLRVTGRSRNFASWELRARSSASITAFVFLVEGLHVRGKNCAVRVPESIVRSCFRKGPISFRRN